MFPSFYEKPSASLFPGNSVQKESTRQFAQVDLITGLETSPNEIYAQVTDRDGSELLLLLPLSF
jgi:hypothetical protein